ncbi:phosphatidylethanolamine-binding protein PEBP protein [Phlyctema vagabunda]|uniref:Phosphatidylethanolamine-binding protein PEBP protein n=1 Tax=Phlyctema vagabunda TaxID=108571 RepID=A0ABR4PLE6_9HELO
MLRIFHSLLYIIMRASSFAILAAAAVVGQASANTPPGVFPVDNNQMTNFYDTSVLATNGVNIPKANTAIAPTVAFDTQLNGTFAIVMFDPDTPATGIGGNGTNSFLHWFQDGLTSVSTPVNVAGRGVFPLANAANIGPVQGYL